MVTNDVKNKSLNQNMYRSFLMISYCLISIFSFAQENDSTKIKNRYSSDLPQCYLVTYQLGYLSSTYGKTIDYKGVVASFGFNPTIFLSSKIILGITCDIKIIPGIIPLNSKSNFVHDFDACYFVPQNSSLDSANASTVNSNIGNKNAIMGNDQFYFGLMFSPYPQKYGGILLQIKRGSVNQTLHGGVYDNKYIDSGGHDKWQMSTKKNWRFELTFKPYAFFRNSVITRYDLRSKDILKSFSVTLFYDYINFKSASFNGTDWNKFLTPEFMNKYRFDNRFGIKVGFSLY